MSTRVTQLQMVNRYMSDLQGTYKQLSDSQRVLSTGRAINTPSDNPVGTAQALTWDAQLSDLEAYQDNVGNALSFVEIEHSALGGVAQTLSRIRELIVQASSSTLDQSGMNSVAAEIRQLKEKIRDDANTKFGAQYIFSGTATNQAPYPTAAGNTYQGNNGLINRRVSPALQVSLNQPGPTFMGPIVSGPLPANMNILDLCDRIVADLTSGLPADREELRTLCLSAVDQNIDTVLQQQANVSASSSRLEVTLERLNTLEERLSAARSEVVDADMAKAYMQFQTQNTMYQSALAAGARIMQSSLVDFL